MGGFSKNHIDSYEKKISIYQLHQMCQDGRLVFPSVSAKTRAKKIERVSRTLEAVLMGMVLPVIYVSERQDGSLLVLDASDRLQYLMEFLEGRCPLDGLEFYPELNGCKMEELEWQFPRITSLIHDYQLFFQIIEYTTSKYMHMQMGNYIEKWNFTREQGIRNELYGKELQDSLFFLEQSLGQSAYFFSKQKLNRQYMILRILMYRFVFDGDIRMKDSGETGLQQLLDETAERLWEKDLEVISDDFRDATERLIKWENRGHHGLASERGKEGQAKILGYLYNIVWICREKGYGVEKGLEKIFLNEQIWENIKREKVTFVNIRRHYHEMEKRLSEYAELHENTGI